MDVPQAGLVTVPAEDMRSAFGTPHGPETCRLSLMTGLVRGHLSVTLPFAAQHSVYLGGYVCAYPYKSQFSLDLFLCTGPSEAEEREGIVSSRGWV